MTSPQNLILLINLARVTGLEPAASGVTVQYNTIAADCLRLLELDNLLQSFYFS